LDPASVRGLSISSAIHWQCLPLADIVAKVSKGAAANFPPKNKTSDNPMVTGERLTLFHISPKKSDGWTI
jgi:hypothetical protein